MEYTDMQNITIEVISENIENWQKPVKRNVTCISQIIQECKIRNTSKIKVIDIIENKPEASRLRGIIAGVCGSIWAFTLVAFNYDKYPIRKLPNHIIEHARRVNNIFDTYVANTDGNISGWLNELKTPAGYNILKRWFRGSKGSDITQYSRLRSKATELLNLTSPIYGPEKIYDIANIKDYMTLKALNDNLIDNLVLKLIQEIRNEYNIVFGSDRVIYGMILLGIFPGHNELMELYSITPYNKELIQEVKQRYVRDKINRLLDEISYQSKTLRNNQFECLISLTLGYGSLEESTKIGVSYNNIGYVLNRIYNWFKNSNEHWKPIDAIKLPLSNKVEFISLDLEHDIYNLIPAYTIGKFIDAGCKTILDILKYLYNGELKQHNETSSLSYREVKYTLAGLGVEECLSVKHINTSEENKALSKRRLLSKGEDWLLTKATISDMELDKDSEIFKTLWKSREQTPASRLINDYNNGKLSYTTDIDGILAFKNKMSIMGFGYLLTYNYLLEFLNTVDNEQDRQYIKELINQQEEQIQWQLL